MVMVGVEMVVLKSPNPWFLDLFIPNQWLSVLALLCHVEEKEHHVLFFSPSLFS
jgi:hypothetical protein